MTTVTSGCKWLGQGWPNYGPHPLFSQAQSQITMLVDYTILKLKVKSHCLST